MYEVIYKFKDLQDNNHLYQVGDKFPYDDKDVSPERCEELSSKNNKIGKILIKKVAIDNENTENSDNNEDNESSDLKDSSNSKLKGRKLNK